VMKIFFQALLCLFTLGAFSQEQFDAGSVKKFQDELNAEYRDAAKSPLTENDRAEFKTLGFFPADQHFFVIAKFKRTAKELPFEMKTTGKRRPMYQKYGELTFRLEGKKMTLNVYQSLDLINDKEYKDYLFLPFADLTSGKESYIGGRYIDLKIPSGKTIAIDFNKAYNPYCAYNHKFSCPVVPLENDLPVAINAGVKKYHD
jgi:uncharacterized protein (DUF1684 family)